MVKLEEIRTTEFLFRASPETVYGWFRENVGQSKSESWFSLLVPIELEAKLLTRNDELVDLALAAWCTHTSTTSTLYNKWCSRTAIPEWPPEPSSYHFAILASLLSNRHSPLAPSIDQGIFAEGFDWLPPRGSTAISVEDFDWLIEHDDLHGVFSLMHRNPGLGLMLLKRCAAKDGAYGRLEDDRWLFALAYLGDNKALHRVNTDDADGPDLRHHDTHRWIVRAVAESPKTNVAAVVVANFLCDLPRKATDGAYVSDAELNDSIAVWSIELPPDTDTGFGSLASKFEGDALKPTERVQFHLLRHYRSYLHLSPEDPLRAIRLAAYAKSTINGGKGWGGEPGSLLSKCGGKGLDIASFPRYAELDGPAFMYANSFNENIWSNEEASGELTDRWGRNVAYVYPADRRTILDNREELRKAEAERKVQEAKDQPPEPEAMEIRLQAIIEKMKEDVDGANTVLREQIGKLKGWLVGGIVIVLLWMVVVR